MQSLPAPVPPWPAARPPLPLPHRGPAHYRHYHVKFRESCHCPWRNHGTYFCHEEAHEVADELIERGYEARVVHH